MNNPNKEKEQRLVIQKFREANYRGTYLGYTGVGKTKIGVSISGEFIRDNPKQKWIVVTPTENLRDKEWVDEYHKWGYKNQIQNIEFVCIQTAYLYKNREYDGIIIDEVHTATSEKYKNFLLNNKSKYLICLTATIDDVSKGIFINEIAPIIHETDIRRAKELKLISPFKIYNLSIPLKPSSERLYNKINLSYFKYQNILGGKHKAFDRASIWLRSGTSEQKKNASMYFKSVQHRKSLLFNAEEKIPVIEELIKLYEDKKIIIFSESIKFAEKIQEKIGHEISAIYHSQISKIKRSEELSLFSSPLSQVRIINSVRALNLGLNVPEVSVGIAASGNSKWLDNVQRTGRTVRLSNNDKMAIYINLYMKNSQELRWVSNRVRKFDTEDVKWISDINQIKNYEIEKR